mgnify:CR=1 FL=1
MKPWWSGVLVGMVAYLLFLLMALLFPEGVPADHNYRTQFMQNRVWYFGVFLLFLCVDVVDYSIKLDKDISIVSHAPYAVFVGSFFVLSLVALKTRSLLFHRSYAAYSILATLVMSITTLVPLTN